MYMAHVCVYMLSEQGSQYTPVGLLDMILAI